MLVKDVFTIEPSSPPAPPAGGARELAEEIVWQRANQELSPEQEIIWLTGKLEAYAAIMRLRTELEHEQAGGVSFTFEERTQVLRYLAMNARGGTWPIDWNSDIVKRVLEKIQPATYSSVRL